MPRSLLLITVFVLVAGVIAVGLVIPTGAVTVDEPAEGFVLEPHDGPNGEYASVSNAVELELHFDRLNDRATSEFDDVFTITADETASVWIEEDLDGVSFYVDYPTRVVDASNPIELDAGETASVGVAIGTHAETPSSETFTLHAEYEGEDEDDESANIELVETTTVDRAVTAGETVTVRATYENHGDTGGTTVARLTVDGVVVDEQVVYVGAGETKTVTFERTMQQSGTFDVGVGEHEPKTVTVESPGEPAPEFDVTDVALEDDSIDQGESTRATATVENAGNASGEFLAELAVDGIVVEDRYVELEPGEQSTVTFERQFDEPGTYAVAVSGLEAGTVSVDESAGYEVLNRELDPTSVAVVGPPAAVGLLFVVGIANRRLDL